MDQNSDSSRTVITADEIMSVAKIDDEYKSVVWRGLNIIVRPLLSFMEVTQFVGSVMDSCFFKEGNMFVPEMADFAIRANVVLRYTNADLPHDIEDQYRLLYGTDFFNEIVGVINGDQYQEITDTIWLLIGRQYKE